MSTPHTLLLRLAGPMQAWGVESRFNLREAGTEPSKSGVIGLVAAALGRPRGADLSDLAALHFGVRVDCEGVPLRDFHTAGNAVLTRTYGSNVRNKRAKKVGYLRARGGIELNDPIVTERHYLADAHFTAGLQANDAAGASLLRGAYNALRNPHWPLFLGRRAFPPSLPIAISEPQALRLLDALLRCPSPARVEGDLRFVLDVDSLAVETAREYGASRRLAGPDRPHRDRHFSERDTWVFHLPLEKVVLSNH